MGNSEYGILVKSEADLKKWREVIVLHNEMGYDSDEENTSDVAVGEELDVCGIINYAPTLSKEKLGVIIPPGLYLICANMGGRCDTIAFLEAHVTSGDYIVEPFNKPADWCDGSNEVMLMDSDCFYDPVATVWAKLNAGALVSETS